MAAFEEGRANPDEKSNMARSLRIRYLSCALSSFRVQRVVCARSIPTANNRPVALAPSRCHSERVYALHPRNFSAAFISDVV